MAPRERTLAIGGLTLRALEWDAESSAEHPDPAPPLLLVHATSFCAEVWGPVLAHASVRGPALALDQRGHGGSDAPDAPEAYRWPRLAEDVAEAATALAASRGRAPVLVGHSSGATASLAAAGMAPDVAAGLVLVEPVLFDRPPPGADSFAGSRTLAERARKRRAAFASREAARAALAERFPYSGFAEASLAAYLAGGLAERDGGVALRCTPEHEAWAYEGAAALDVWPRVAKVRAPVCVLAAEHTGIPRAQLARLERTLPDCRVERVSGATHFAALERPDEVGRRLGAFLSERRVGGAP